MKDNFDFKNIKKVHFIGVGGISMSALAKYCLRMGKCVSGSDRSSEGLDELASLGARVYSNHSVSNIENVDLCVYSSSINFDNEELKFCQSENIPTLKRSEFLGKILTRYHNVVAVSGCHGKTTVTAMLANVFKFAGLNPTVFLGGSYKDYSNFRYGGFDYAIVEACEYQKNFLDLYHTFSVVLNVDYDHMETYGNMQTMIDTYKQFCSGTTKAINYDCERCVSLTDGAITFGRGSRARVRAKNVTCKGGKYCFSVYYFNQPLGQINLNVLGEHNIMNALAVVSACLHYNIPFSIIKKGLEDFKGVKRRLELIGSFNSMQAYCDYAHHPEEIDKTIKAISQVYPNTLFVFQPHTYSRTRLLMDKFVSVLKGVDVIIYKAFPAREKYDKKGSAKTLFNNLLRVNNSVAYCLSDKQLKSAIEKQNANKKYSAICFLGAGDIYNIANKTCKNF